MPRSSGSGRSWSTAPSAQVADYPRQIDDLLEGTEQIQQLVIARSVSGRHIA